MFDSRGEVGDMGYLEVPECSVRPSWSAGCCLARVSTGGVVRTLMVANWGGNVGADDIGLGLLGDDTGSLYI